MERQTKLEIPLLSSIVSIIILSIVGCDVFIVRTLHSYFVSASGSKHLLLCSWGGVEFLWKTLLWGEIQKPKLPNWLNLNFHHALSLFSLPSKTKPSILKNTCLWITIPVVPHDSAIIHDNDDVWCMSSMMMVWSLVPGRQKTLLYRQWVNF